MSGRAISPSAVVGSVAAAATTGALIAIGHRAGSSGLPFAAIGAVLVHRTPSAGEAGLVLTGLVLHVAAMFVWSAAFVRLALRVTAKDWIAAGIVVAAHFVVARMVAVWTGNGLASVLALGDRIAFAAVLAGALVVGMRFARVWSRDA